MLDHMTTSTIMNSPNHSLGLGKRTILLLGLLLSGTVVIANAQDGEQAVRDVIDQLFDGMRESDSSMVAGVFHEGALMGRAMEEGYRLGPVDGFVRAVASSKDTVWDERIWDVRINIDDRLATAWMEYAFYLGDDLHHCGVNSMQLYRSDDGWTITYLADTDRGLECNEPSSRP